MFTKNKKMMLVLLLGLPVFSQAEEPLGSAYKQMIKLQTYNLQATQENKALVASGLGVQSETASQLQRKFYGKSRAKVMQLNTGNGSKK